MKKLGSALVTIVAFLGGAGEVWAVDWDECQRTEFSKLQSDIVIPACSRIIDAGEVSPSDLAEAHYRRGRGHHRKGNLDPTIADYNKAAQQGHAEAQYELGSIHSQGWGEDSWGVPQNYAEAVKWYRMAAEQSLADAQKSLGVMYYLGEGVPQDYAEAAKWFLKAAEQGHADGQTLLGNMYFYGQAISQDYIEAAKWYRRAADQGWAQPNLGVMYANGLGVPQDYAEAAKWYRLAAEQGNAGAQVNLGIMYAEGQGVPQDYVLALVWFNIAAAQGRKNTQRNRDRLAKRMTPDQIAAAQRMAREWMNKHQK